MKPDNKPAIHSKSILHTKWKVFHIVNGKEMTQEQLIEQYSKQIARATIKVIDMLAKKHGVKVTVRADSSDSKIFENRLKHGNDLITDQKHKMKG